MKFLTLLKKYNIIENKKVIFWLNIATFLFIPLFALLFTFVVYLFYGLKDFSLIASIDNQLTSIFSVLLFFLFLFLIIVIHELIHGLFFKLLNAKAKVHFGFKNGMAYATSPDTFYSKSRFITISLAPFVIITLGLFSLLSMGLISKFSFIFYASLHASSCVGDFYWVFLLSRFNEKILVKDTEKGINVYSKE